MNCESIVLQETFRRTAQWYVIGNCISYPIQTNCNKRVPQLSRIICWCGPSRSRNSFFFHDFFFCFAKSDYRLDIWWEPGLPSKSSNCDDLISFINETESTFLWKHYFINRKNRSLNQHMSEEICRTRIFSFFKLLFKVQSS